jgi:hypothetical protein
LLALYDLNEHYTRSPSAALQTQLKLHGLVECFRRILVACSHPVADLP